MPTVPGFFIYSKENFPIYVAQACLINKEIDILNIFIYIFINNIKRLKCGSCIFIFFKIYVHNKKKNMYYSFKPIGFVNNNMLILTNNITVYDKQLIRFQPFVTINLISRWHNTKRMRNAPLCIRWNFVHFQNFLWSLHAFIIQLSSTKYICDNVRNPNSRYAQTPSWKTRKYVRQITWPPNIYLFVTVKLLFAYQMC